MIDKYYKEFRVRDYIENEGIMKDSNRNNIDCSLGTNPFIDENLINKYIGESEYIINEYPVNSYNLLKEELIKFWKNNAELDNLKSENISFGTGSMGIMRNLSEFLIEKDTYVLGCSPQFPRFISEVELKRGIYEYYSLEKENNFKFIAKDFISKISSKYSVIYIDNPNNPTGQIIDVNDIENITKHAKKYDITVIIDEAYGDYMNFKNSAVTLVDRYDNLVVLKSASKFFGLPNHRIGYLVSNKEFIKIYDMITLPFYFSDMSCNLFIKLLRSYSKIEGTKRKVVEANKEILGKLNKDNYLYTSLETPIFTIKSNKYENLTDELIKRGVITENTSNFINLNSQYARIRIPRDYEKLIKILVQVL